MKLRCRKGQKAILLAGPYTGYTVTIVDFLGNVHAQIPSGGHIMSKDAWEVRCPQIPGGFLSAEDASLHPIYPIYPYGLKVCGR